LDCRASSVVTAFYNVLLGTLLPGVHETLQPTTIEDA